MTKLLRLVALAGLMVVASVGPAHASGPTGGDDNPANCSKSALVRPAPVIYRPANLSRAAPVPLVIDLAIAAPATAEANWPLDAVATRHHFVVAYLGSACPSWLDPIANLPYISSMIDRLKATENVDPSRVYATGFSKAGYMAYYVGCDLSSKIAAVAIMSSAMVGQPCQVARPVSELTILGTRDIIPVQGNSKYPSVAATAAEWRRLDGCPAGRPATAQAGSALQRTWAPCADGSSVAFYLIQGGHHVIPGSPGLPASDPDAQFGAAQAVWAFFAAHKAGSLHAPSATLVSVRNRRSGSQHQLLATLRLGEKATAKTVLRSGGRVVKSKLARLRPGRRVIALQLPAGLRAGLYTVTIRVQDSYGRVLSTSRSVGLS
jgi:polyhydroxybutyrate depolymerase